MPDMEKRADQIIEYLEEYVLGTTLQPWQEAWIRGAIVYGLEDED